MNKENRHLARRDWPHGWAPWKGCQRAARSLIMAAWCAAACNAASGGNILAQPYAIVPLSDDALAFGVDINVKEQVAFTELFEQPDPGVYRARFFDGARFYTLGNFGGNNAFTAALNRLGEVVGTADTPPTSAPYDASHAYRWSRSTGLLDLSTTRLRASVGADINDRGDVVGSAIFDPAIDVFHAARWNAHNRPQDLGTLAGGRSFAIAANDAGTVVGWSQAPQSASLTIPFRWTAERGMQPLGTAASEAGSARAINREGTVVGTAPLREGDPDHGFLWSPREGLVDLGTGSGTASGATGVNDQGMVTGFVSHFPNFGIGFVWTRSGGMIELGKPHANSSTADDLNNRGQVVGGIDGRAFVWTQGSGIVDLNTKVRGSPQGLVLRQALAINDGGAIVALTNTGLVLLTRRTLSGLRPLAGPIVVTGAARAGTLLSFSVHFTDVDVRETHTASWHWGEGQSEPGTLSERNGSGHVSGQHRYEAEGEYPLTLTITDSSGRRTTVRLLLLVAGPTPCKLTGQGWFASPPGATGLAHTDGGLVTYAFALPIEHVHGKEAVRFDGAGIRFRSSQVRIQKSMGARLTYRGAGSVNGLKGYQFLLSTVAQEHAADDPRRFRIRIWRQPAGTPAQVVYDNLDDETGSGGSRGERGLGEH